MHAENVRFFIAFGFQIHVTETLLTCSRCCRQENETASYYRYFDPTVQGPENGRKQRRIGSRHLTTVPTSEKYLKILTGQRS